MIQLGSERYSLVILRTTVWPLQLSSRADETTIWHGTRSQLFCVRDMNMACAWQRTEYDERLRSWNGTKQDLSGRHAVVGRATAEPDRIRWPLTQKLRRKEIRKQLIVVWTQWTYQRATVSMHSTTWLCWKKDLPEQGRSEVLKKWKARHRTEHSTEEQDATNRILKNVMATRTLSETDH